MLETARCAMGMYAEFGRMESAGWSDQERAHGYVHQFSALADQAVDPLLEAVEPAPGNFALDLCCGHGNVTEMLMARKCRATGLDFSPAMLRLARERVPSATFIEADAQRIPFAAGSFQVVVSNFGVCHVPDQQQVLREVSRVLEPGGRFAMTVWCGPAHSPAFDLLHAALRSHGSPAAQLPAGPDFHQFADQEVAKRLLHESGFRDVHSRMVPCAWRFDSPGSLYDVFERATVRAAALLAAQPEEARERIRQAMESAVRERHSGDQSPWIVPMPAMLVSARK